MPHYRIACGACANEFDVDADDDRERCPSCGAEHEGPWHDPQLLSQELAEILDYDVAGPRVVMQPAVPGGGPA